MKRPSFQFYPGDWLKDAALRMVSVGARGLWVDMICYMHQGSPYGHLKVNSKVVTEIQLARMVGGELGEVKSWLNELYEAGVYSLADDGAMFSRRMVKDEELREVRAAGGKEGGNPKLIGGYNKPGFVYAMLRESDAHVKIGISQDPAKRLYKVRAQYPGVAISVIGKLYVEDMGEEEARLHAMFAHCKNGEWFAMSDSERSNLLDVHLKANTKAKQKVSKTPSSSSSSSSTDTKDIVGQQPDGEGASVSDDIEKIFEYWRKCMESPKSKLDDKRRGVIRRALKAGYSPRDLCRAIQGCALTPHNQGVNDRGQKYLGIHVCLKDADQIDRFMANAKAPPVAPEKKGSGQIPGWWKDDELAKQQAALVGVSGPHPSDNRDTFHARIRAAIENGGKPPAPVVATAPAPAAPEPDRVAMTDEQKAANRAALQAALKGTGVKINGSQISME